MVFMRANNIGGKLITSLICCAAWALHLPLARCATAPAHPWAATDVLVATDGKLADLYVNGHRLAKKEIVPVATSSGVSLVDLWIHTHPGDWLVFHVVCPKGLMQRRGIAVAGRRRGDDVLLSEEQTLQWCAISNAGQAPAFIATRDYLRKSSAVIPRHPSHRCFTMLAQHTDFSNGEVIWARGNSLNVWIKCLVPRHKTPPTGVPSDTGKRTEPAVKIQLSAAQPIANGVYSLTNQYSHLVLNDPGRSDQPGTAIDQATTDGGKHQKWKFTYQGHGLYTIKNELSALYLSGAETNPQPGDLLRQEFPSHRANQQWKLQRKHQGFLCINAASGLAMDDYGHHVNPGTAVDLWSVHHIKTIGNQTWLFHKARGAQAGMNPQIMVSQVVRKPAPVITFTDALAQDALRTYQTKIHLARKLYQKQQGQAATACAAILHDALLTAMTTNHPGQTRKLTDILTAMRQPSYRPAMATTFTIRSAQYAWRKYMVSLAQARANYLIARDHLRRRFASTLAEKALMKAIQSGNVTDALLINKIIQRLDRENRNPLKFASDYPRYH